VKEPFRLLLKNSNAAQVSALSSFVFAIQQISSPIVQFHSFLAIGQPVRTGGAGSFSRTTSPGWTNLRIAAAADSTSQNS
jgi:hypothetical protein